ncbi:hypothetical protein ACF0H5_012457 [Mactra antiquata]
MSNSPFSRKPLIELAIILALILSTWANDMIPYFTTEPSSVVITQDSSTTLHCGVHPSSSVIRWKYNNEFFEENNVYGFKQIGSDLHIPSVPHHGHGYEIDPIFQCVAQNSMGTLLSRPAKLNKAVLRNFDSRPDLHLNASEGSNFVVPCRPPYSRPKAKIMFKFNQTTIIDKDTDHHQILPSGNMLIINVTENDVGQYQCMAENKLRNRTRTAKHKVHLEVIKSNALSQKPAKPTVIMPTTELKVQVGQNAVLECSAVGNPQPVITWKKYGGELNHERYKQLHGNLYIDKVSLEDDGTYYLCTATNGYYSLMEDGLKAITLKVSDPPRVEAVKKVVNVSLGGHIDLMCLLTKGKPKPKITWYHNGNLLKASTEDRLSIRNADGSHQGLYQCFCENEAGVSHSTMLVNVDVTKHDSGSLTLSDQNVTKAEGDLLDRQETPAGQEPKKRRDRKRHKSHKKKKKLKIRKPSPTVKTNTLLKVPPSKPEVTRLSDTSVMLNWTVRENEGLSITFFRVQYKKVGPNKGSWKTDDVEIESHRRKYEVNGLTPRATYKFRIAAVYSDNDNAIGPNSDRFEMEIEPGPVPRPPSKEPTIVEVIAIDHQHIHALNVKWRHNIVSSIPIEGFYIYYKPYHAKNEPFQNVTLLQPSVRTHLLTNLQPGTEYLIRMQSFNGAGNSSFSNEVVEKTLGNPGPYTPTLYPPPKQGDKNIHQTPVSPTKKSDEVDSENNRSSRTSTQSSSEMLYMILGIVLGVMMLLLIVFMFMCWCKQRQQRRMMDAMNDAVRNKFQDPSQRIYADSLRKKMVNGGLPINGMNGTIANGHIPRSYQNMNINVNPLSDLDTINSTDGSNHFASTTFHPNGSLQSQHRTSDNNCNNINQSKSLQNSLQHINHPSYTSSGEGETLGSGEGMANPLPSMCKNVPIGHNSEANERRSLSNRSCDHGSCDPCDSSLSYDDTGGVHNSSRHRKRRRRANCKEQTTKDQATNTDLSSNDGTMELSESNKAISSSQESGPLVDYTTQTVPSTNNVNNMLVSCSNAV